MTELNTIRHVAVIGSGIAGLTAAHLFAPHVQVTLFEKNNYIGGHTHTVDVRTAGGDYAIDTGFIVFNHKTYPNFVKLLNRLQVVTQKSTMSFSFSSQRLGLEYGTESVSALFAERKNILSPRFYRLLWDIAAFNRRAKRYLKSGPENQLLDDFINKARYGDYFNAAYLMPMAAAIWSMPPGSVADVPARFMLDFYYNHGLLNLIDHPQWYVIQGGSKAYIDKITRPFADKIYLNTPVKRIERYKHHVKVVTEKADQKFDMAIIACHSDQAIDLLVDPTSAETAVLGNIPYFSNTVILHTDSTAMPAQKNAWGSWNYIDEGHENASLTYYMNKLQSLDADEDFFVSINSKNINQEKIIKTFTYAHPTYSQKSIAAKANQALINNESRLRFVGAYWGNGFHECGVLSSLNALADLGLQL